MALAKCPYFRLWSGLAGLGMALKIKALKTKWLEMANTGGEDLVERPERLVGRVAGDVVSEADGGERDEAVVDRVEVVPVGLHGVEDGGRHEEEEDDEHDGDEEQVEHSDVERLVQVAQLGVQVLQQPRGRHHEPVHQRRQQHQRHRDADQRVHDAEDLAALRQRRHVAVTCTCIHPSIHSAIKTR